MRQKNGFLTLVANGERKRGDLDCFSLHKNLSLEAKEGRREGKMYLQEEEGIKRETKRGRPRQSLRSLSLSLSLSLSPLYLLASDFITRLSSLRQEGEGEAYTSFPNRNTDCDFIQMGKGEGVGGLGREGRRIAARYGFWMGLGEDVGGSVFLDSGVGR